MRHIALVDNKHNNKNSHGQAVTGTSPSSLGLYVLVPWYLKLAMVEQVHYHIEDSASDTDVLHLFSSSTISKLIKEEFHYVGNVAVLVVTLTFIHLCNYSVNAKNFN